MSSPIFDDDLESPDDSGSKKRRTARRGVTDSRGEGVRPAGLTVICVLAIVLGGLGLLTGCIGLTSQAFASGMQNAFAMPGGANLPGADVQKEMNARIMAAANRYKWITLPLMVLKIIVEGALLAGAIMSMGLKPRGWSWLHGALIVAIVFECVYAVPTVLIQRETQVVMREMMPKVVEAQQGANKAPPGVNNVLSGFFSVVSVASMIIAVGWLAAKVVYCGLGIRYLRKPEVRALFALPEGDTFEAQA